MVLPLWREIWQCLTKVNTHLPLSQHFCFREFTLKIYPSANTIQNFYKVILSGIICTTKLLGRCKSLLDSRPPVHKLWFSYKMEYCATIKRMRGIPGWHSGLAPAFGPGRDPGDPGSNPTSGSRCMEPASPSACVSASLSLSVCDYHK